MPKSPEPIYTALGARLQMIRQVLGIDQTELGKRLGLTRTSVTNIEAGRQRVQLHQLQKMADSLGTTPKQMMKGIWW